MISGALAQRLHEAGLRWHPRPGDRFAVRTLEDQVFTISDMVVEPHDYPTGTVLGFNGTTEMTPERVAALTEDVSLVARALLRYRLLIPAVAISKSRRVRTAVRRSLADAFEHFDLLAWPTVAAPAPALDNPPSEVPSGTYPADYLNPSIPA